MPKSGDGTTRTGMTRCEICGKEFENQKGVNTHIRFKHKEWTIERYYLVFFPRKCIMCNKIIPFKGEKYLQYKFCSKECMIKRFSMFVPKNKGDLKYDKEMLLQYLRELHKKYGGVITQHLINLNGVFRHQIYHSYFGSFTKACELAGVPYYTYTYEKEKETFCGLTIVCDTREKKPYNIYPKVVERLDVADYKLKDYNGKVRIERKDINDLRGTMGKGLERFWRELERAREKDLYVVVLIDGTKESLWKHNFSIITPYQIMHNIKKTVAEFGDVCQFVFTGGRKNSTRLLIMLLTMPLDIIRELNLQEMIESG